MAIHKTSVRSLIFLAAIMGFFAVAAAAQDKPVFTAYREVAIGMPASDARTKLGKPKEESDAEDYFEFSGNESVRVLYDKNKKIRAISVTYSAKESSAPTPQAVLGVAVEARPDGGMFKMVEYPKQKFWVSHVRTGGDEPLVIVTIQKIGE